MEVIDVRENWQMILRGKCPVCGKGGKHFLEISSWKDTEILRCNSCFQDFAVTIRLEPYIDVYKLERESV